MPNYRYNRSLSLFLRAIALTADLSEACWMDTRVRTAGKKIETERKKDGGRVCNINVLVDIVFPSACTQGSGRRDEERERERRESVGQRAKFSKGKLRTGPPSTQPLQRGKIPSLRAWMMNVGTFQVPLAALSLSLFLPPPFRVAVLC